MGTGIVFNNLLFTTTSEAIIIRRIDRRELPHLSIFFKTASGEIDGHLKDEMAPPGVDPYTSLFRFPIGRLTELTTDYVPRFAAEVLKLSTTARKVRPSWLRAKGYVLAIMDPAEMKARFLDAAPKVRGNLRVDVRMLKTTFADPSQLELLDPFALHSSELKNRGETITAVRGFGRNRMLGLIYAQWFDGHGEWLIVNPFAEALPSLFVESVPFDLRQSVRDAWFKIYEALRLDEVGVARE